MPSLTTQGAFSRTYRCKDWEEGIYCHRTVPLPFCKEAVPTMIAQEIGSIINISSSNALIESSNC